MIFCGIDPGISGAIAFYDAFTGDVDVVDMPILVMSRGGRARRELDPHALADLFWKRHCGHATLEQAWVRPNDSGPGAFSVGNGYGAIRGVLAAVGVPYTIASPQKWKKALGITADKDGARARASQLLPQAAGQWPLKKHDGRAEAALLALHGFRDNAGLAPPRPTRAAAAALAARAEPAE